MPQRRPMAFHRCLRPCSIAAALVIGGATAALACTTMVLGPQAHRLVAYSYDQPSSGAGMLVVNPKGVARSSIMDPPQAAWAARHGSVTFNQFGLGMPTAGMNTAGLVVTLMWNADASYGAPTGDPQLNELELIQHLLDTAATVDEALAVAGELHVQGLVPIHYFLVDRHGDTAGLRPGNGELVATRGADLPSRRSPTIPTKCSLPMSRASLRSAARMSCPREKAPTTRTASPASPVRPWRRSGAPRA